MAKNHLKLFSIFLFAVSILFMDQVFAQDLNTNEMLANAEESFLKGEYNLSIKIYDEILKMEPNNYKILEMKGLALSNSRLGTTLASQAQTNYVQNDPSILNKLSMIPFLKTCYPI